MDSKHASQIFLEIVALWSLSGEYQKTEQKVWCSFLKKIDFLKAGETINKLYESRGQQNFDSLMKLLPDFKGFYYGDYGGNKKWCPCCNGSSWLSFPETLAGTSYRCHCRTREEKLYNLCENLNCQNPEQDKILYFKAGFSIKHPHISHGFKRCNYNPSISEKKDLLIPVDAKEIITKLRLTKDTNKYRKPQDFKKVAANDF